MSKIRFFAGLALAAASCILLYAQTGKTITIELRDGRTGKPVVPSNFLLRVDHNETLRNEWVTIHDDNTATITIPDDVKEISMQATYGDGTDYYVNCDAAKQNDKEREIWYSIATIMQTGVVAPNECAKTQYPAKAGVFLFFVRKRGVFDPLPETRD
jgi:hypothetical protein